MGEIKISWPLEGVFVHFHPVHFPPHWQSDNKVNLHLLINSSVTLPAPNFLCHLQGLLPGRWQ